ncbi:MAG: FAD-dependent oxidoreductase [Candidatus Bathyarchaeia archaeon]
MPKIVVVGGGWSGCAAALAAAKAGAEAVLLERTDMLLGTGLVGGIFRNNGRFTAAEEAIAMGGGELFHIMDNMARHKNIDFPGHKHASLYDVTNIEPEVRKFLKEMGIKIMLQSRCIDVKKEGAKITAVILEDKTEIDGDAFVDCTGTAGVPGNCIKYGYGCAMCVLRCHSFKPRVSITEKAGVKEWVGKKADGTPGAISGACKLMKHSLSPEIQKELNIKGVLVKPLPVELVKQEKLKKKACVQYALREFAENIVLLDTGPAKLMAPFFPLEELRKLPGFEHARYEDPLAGGIGNSVRFMAMAPRDNTLKVHGVKNLFCAGEKAGPHVGHTEAIVTGLLAGHNAVREALGMELLEIPTTTVIGDFISFVNNEVQTEEGQRNRYTFSGGLYFERIKKKGLYTIDVNEIYARVKNAGLIDIFSKKLTK